MTPTPHGTTPSYDDLLRENEALRWQVEEAEMMLEAIRTGGIDALVVQGESGHELYTLSTADAGYRVFIETMNEGAVTLSEDGVILYCNPAFAALAGTPANALLSAPLGALVANDSRRRYETFFQPGHEQEGKVELLLAGRSGPIPCQFSVTPFLLDGRPVLSVIVTDLTEQKAAQAQLKEKARSLQETNTALERSNHDLLQFASVASHDLQEPLRKMLVFGGLAQQQLRDAGQPKALGLVDKLIASATRMKRLVVDILDYSQLSLDDHQRTAVDLNAVVAEVLDDYELLIAEKGAVVDLEPLPTLRANRGQVQQVFQNLIGNALKFAHPDRIPHLRIQTVGGVAVGLHAISVADNGIGFDPQYEEKIFSLFQRLNTKDQYEGSGIGLAVTRKILEKHRGTIRAEAVPGGGATFTLTLPA